MREIKFRIPVICQSGHKAYWYYEIDYHGIQEFKRTSVKSDCKCPKLNIGEGWSRNGGDEQYTGLKDKNGKEIYEGDIVEFVDFRGVYVNKQSKHDGDVIVRAVIKWSKFGYGFIVDKENEFNANLKKRKPGEHYDRDLPYILGMEHLVGRHVKVIGNIYENPELLKKGN